MSRLIWIFRFAAGRFSDGRKLAVGGMALSAKKSLRFANAALNWSLRASAKSLSRYYFGLNDDLEQISRCIGRDDYIKKALQRFEGLRIVRQMPWECLISFICATYKSIAAIELMLSKLSVKFGEKKAFDGMEFYTFPTAEKLAFASENGLRECGLGYRAKYVQATAKKICRRKN